jgi:hypothetical protein
VITVFLFQSSALAPGANATPISAIQHTLVAGLNSFIISFPPWLQISLLFASAGMSRGLFGGIPGAVSSRSYVPAFGSVTEFERSVELTLQGHVTECGHFRLLEYARPSTQSAG